MKTPAVSAVLNPHLGSADSPAAEFAQSLHRAGVGIAGVQDEAEKWHMGVERDGRILFLDAEGKSSKKPNEFGGDFLKAYREGIRRMKAWQLISGRTDYTIYMNPLFADKAPGLAAASC